MARNTTRLHMMRPQHLKKKSTQYRKKPSKKSHKCSGPPKEPRSRRSRYASTNGPRNLHRLQRREKNTSCHKIWRRRHLHHSRHRGASKWKPREQRSRAPPHGGTISSTQKLWTQVREEECT